MGPSLGGQGSGSWVAGVAKCSHPGRAYSARALCSGQHRANRDGDPGCQPHRGGLAQGCEPPGAGADDPLPEEGGERRELHQRHHTAGLGEAPSSPSGQSCCLPSASSTACRALMCLALCSALVVAQGNNTSYRGDLLAGSRQTVHHRRPEGKAGGVGAEQALEGV